MPPEMDWSGVGDPGATSEGEKKPSETPAFATAADLQALQTSIPNLIQQSVQAAVASVFDAVAADRAARGEHLRESAPDPDVTDAEIEEALAQGTGAAKFRKLVRAEASKLAGPLAAKVDQLEREGLALVANLSGEVAGGKLKYWKRYEKEIGAYLERVPPAVRAQSATLKLAHDAVVGSHQEELEAEAIERARRAASQPAGGQEPGSATGRGAAAEKLPTVEEEFGREAVEALRFVGKTPDQFAQRLGYKDYGEYVALKRSQEEAGVA